MHEAVRQQYEAFPHPSPTLEPIGPKQLDRMDDNLHFGWGWHRHRYCYRRGEKLQDPRRGMRDRVIHAGTGAAEPGVGGARGRRLATGAGAGGQAAAVLGMPDVEFAAHDLDRPLPVAWGPFDFVVCRGVLGQAEDPDRILANLGRVLDSRGLLHVTLPSRHGRQAARQLRRAVAALAGPEAGLEGGANRPDAVPGAAAGPPDPAVRGRSPGQPRPEYRAADRGLSERGGGRLDAGRRSRAR